MRIRHLVTAAAALSTLGVTVAAAAPATADTPNAVTCTNNGTKYSIAQDGINIRATPGGAIKHSIAKTATFLSLDNSTQDLGRTCTSNADPSSGTLWVYGEGRASGVVGWVGLNYMNVIGTGSSD